MRSLLLVLLLLLPGCAMSTRWTAQEVYLKTRQEYDAFKKETTWSAPVESMLILTGRLYYRLKCVAEDDTKVYMLKLQHIGQEWQFFDEAYTDSGQKLWMITGDTEITLHGSVSEVEVIPLDLEDLKDKVWEGVSVRVYGRKGRYTIKLSPAYIHGFLRATGVLEVSQEV